MKIFIAGHKGMVGSAILKKIANKTNIKIYIVEKNALDLLNQSKVLEYFNKTSFFAM